MQNACVANLPDRTRSLLASRGANRFRIRGSHPRGLAGRDTSRLPEGRVDAGADPALLPSLGGRTAKLIFEMLKAVTCRRLKRVGRDVFNTVKTGALHKKLKRPRPRGGRERVAPCPRRQQ